MDVFLDIAFWVIVAAFWLTAFAVTISHIVGRADRLPSWLRGWWIRRDAKDPRREGWGWLFLFAGLAFPGFANQITDDNLGFDTTYACSFALMFVGGIIHSWPQVSRFLRWIHTKRQQN